MEQVTHVATCPHGITTWSAGEERQTLQEDEESSSPSSLARGGNGAAIGGDGGTGRDSSSQMGWEKSSLPPSRVVTSEARGKPGWGISTVSEHAFLAHSTVMLDPRRSMVHPAQRPRLGASSARKPALWEESGLSHDRQWEALRFFACRYRRTLGQNTQSLLQTQ
jgi:hypothetical protein